MPAQRLIGTEPNQVPLNQMLGRMAFMDPDNLGPITTEQLKAFAIGKLSRDDGKTLVGTELKEVSNDPDLVASTGQVDSNTVPTQNAVYSFVTAYSSSRTRWGEIFYGKKDVGTPGGDNFSIADPPFTDYQFEFFVFPILSRVEELEQKLAVLWDAYLREVALRQIGLTIGQAGLVNFGVGPAVNSGTPVPVGSEQDYYPIHAASNSFM